MTHPPRFTTVPPKPCDSCPVKTWAVMHDPSSIEGERRIRADQRRLDFRELQATARDLAWHLEHMDRDPVQALARIRSITARLITLSERRHVA